VNDGPVWLGFAAWGCKSRNAFLGSDPGWWQTAEVISITNIFFCTFQGDPGEVGKPVSLLFLRSRLGVCIRHTALLPEMGGSHSKITLKMQLRFH
jgi:hypothetical protein